MRETNKVKSLTPVSIGVLEENEATNEKEVKGGSNTSFGSIKGASSIELDFRRRKDS